MRLMKDQDIQKTMSTSYPRHILYSQIFLAAFVLLVFSFSMKNGFSTGDDYALRYNAPLWLYTPLTGLYSLFSKILTNSADSRYGSDYYRPLFMLHYVLTYRIWGLDAFGFHVMNIIYHLVSVIILFRVGMLLFDGDLRKALLGAAIFGVHPVHNQTVGAVGPADAQYGMLIILCLYFFLKKRPVFSWIAFIFALFSKETSVGFLVPLMIASFYQKGPRKGLIASAPYMTAVTLYIVMRLSVLGRLAPNSAAMVQLPVYILTMATATFDYVRLLIVPYPLSPYYPARWYASIADPKAFLALLSVPFGFIAAYRMRRNAVELFLLITTFLMLAPAILMVNTFPFGNETVYIAERYLYLPSMFFSLLLASLIVRLLEKKADRYLPVAAVFLVLLLSAITISSYRVWRNGIVLFGRIVHEFPGTAVAHSNLGFAYKEAGLDSEAAREYRTASVLLFNKGIECFNKGLYTDAIQNYLIAVEINPGFAEAYNNIGNAYIMMGLTDDAITNYHRAIKLSPANPSAHANLAAAFRKKGMAAEAGMEERRALEIMKRAR